MFQRGTWRCQVKGCGGEAELGMLAWVRTTGGRRGRIQRSSNTVRICAKCGTDIIKGKIPDEVSAALAQAIMKTRGEAQLKGR